MDFDARLVLRSQEVNQEGRSTRHARPARLWRNAFTGYDMIDRYTTEKIGGMIGIYINHGF